jgi:hypothetical protein
MDPSQEIFRRHPPTHTLQASSISNNHCCSLNRPSFAYVVVRYGSYLSALGCFCALVRPIVQHLVQQHDQPISDPSVNHLQRFADVHGFQMRRDSHACLMGVNYFRCDSTGFPRRQSSVGRCILQVFLLPASGHYFATLRITHTGVLSS